MSNVENLNILRAEAAGDNKLTSPADICAQAIEDLKHDDYAQGMVIMFEVQDGSPVYTWRMANSSAFEALAILEIMKADLLARIMAE